MHVSEYKVRVAKSSCCSARSPAAASELWVQSLPAFLSQGWPGQGLAEVQSSVSEELLALSALLSGTVWMSNSCFKIISTNNKNFPLCFQMCHISLKKEYLGKDSLNCLEIMCCVIVYPKQNPLKEHY